MSPRTATGALPNKGQIQNNHSFCLKWMLVDVSSQNHQNTFSIKAGTSIFQEENERTLSKYTIQTKMNSV